MSTHKALVVLEKGGEYVVRDIPTPKPGPGELLVEVKATALNPVDWKVHDHGYFISEWPAILGSDAAGVVKEIGEGVTGFAVGDRVIHQGFFTNAKATHQQYSIVPAEIAAKLPSNLSFEEGSTLPLVAITAVYGFYSGKVSTGDLLGAELTAPWEEGGRGKYAGQPIVIVGGSSGVGQQAIQFAKLSGFSPIITTASLKNADFLKSLGATHVVDRNADLASSVKAITSEPLKYVFDAIGLKQTQEAAYELVAPGGTLLVVLDVEIDEAKRDKSKRTARIWGTSHDPRQNAVAVSFYKNFTKLLESGDIKPNRVEIVPNGLAGIPDALEKLKADAVSAAKLVAQPWA
ncbi:GroES-like protein [Irpex lacteus]|nr:GroES-like protein [Irpex lacteus]